MLRSACVQGISDGIPKLLAYRLLSSVTNMSADVRLICDEGEFETLLADLALHRLDVVLTDRSRTGRWQPESF